MVHLQALSLKWSIVCNPKHCTFTFVGWAEGCGKAPVGTVRIETPWMCTQVLVWSNRRLHKNSNVKVVYMNHWSNYCMAPWGFTSFSVSAPRSVYPLTAAGVGCNKAIKWHWFTQCSCTGDPDTPSHVLTTSVLSLMAADKSDPITYNKIGCSYPTSCHTLWVVKSSNNVVLLSITTDNGDHSLAPQQLQWHLHICTPRDNTSACSRCRFDRGFHTQQVQICNIDPL